jgi:hypothetical protein
MKLIEIKKKKKKIGGVVKKEMWNNIEGAGTY